MKNNKGFTLIELLAVIVILGLVMAISIPEILSLLEETKKETMRLSVESIEHSINTQIHTLELKGEDFSGIFTVVNGKIQEANGYTLNIDKNYNGTLEIDDNKKIAIAVNNSRYCAKKIKSSSKIEINELASGSCEMKKIINKNICYVTQNGVSEGQNFAFILNYDPPTFEIDYDMCITKMNDINSVFGTIGSELNESQISKLCNGERIDYYDYAKNQSSFDINLIIGPYILLLDFEPRFGGDLELQTMKADYEDVIKNYNPSGNICPTEVDIPDKIDNNLVMGVIYGFANKKLTKITLPSTFSSTETMINLLAFSPNSLIGENPFIYARNTDGTINKDTIFGYGGPELNTSLVIPDGTITIGDSAFKDISIESLTISSSVKSILDSAFDNSDIINLNLGNGVETIESDAFSHNYITNLTLSDNLKTIDDSAFEYNELTNLTIPSSVEAIGDAAFASNQLTNVTFLSPVSIPSYGIELSAFRKSETSNPNLTSIIYPGTTQQDWNNAINGSSSTPFTTGAVTNALGDVTISSN